MHRLLRKRARAVQYSVFLAELTPYRKARLIRALADLIDPRFDDVRFYPVPPGSALTVHGPSLLPDGVMLFDGTGDRATEAPERPPARNTGARLHTDDRI